MIETMPAEAVSDVLIVGGGIAGSTLAAVLARNGAGVTVLERQVDHVDRVRGEYLHPWGVAEAQRLGIHEDLRRAGGVHVTGGIGYDENTSPEIAEAPARDISKMGRDGAARFLSDYSRMVVLIGDAAGYTTTRSSARALARPARRPRPVRVAPGFNQLVIQGAAAIHAGAL